MIALDLIHCPGVLLLSCPPPAPALSQDVRMDRASAPRPSLVSSELQSVCKTRKQQLETGQEKKRNHALGEHTDHML